MRLSRQPKGPVDPAAGDVVVVKVGSVYYIGRARGVGQPFAPIGMRSQRAEAISHACAAAGRAGRVLLYATTGATGGVEVECVYDGQNLAG
jgi:hypothetical protein